MSVLGFDVDKTKAAAPAIERLGPLPAGADGVMHVDVFKRLEAQSGSIYMIAEFTVIEPMSDVLKKGDRFSHFIDISPSRVYGKGASAFNYGHVDTIKFLEAVNGGPFEEGKASVEAEAVAADIAKGGYQVRVKTTTKKKKDGVGVFSVNNFSKTDYDFEASRKKYGTK